VAFLKNFSASKTESTKTQYQHHRWTVFEGKLRNACEQVVSVTEVYTTQRAEADPGEAHSGTLLVRFWNFVGRSWENIKTHIARCALIGRHRRQTGSLQQRRVYQSVKVTSALTAVNMLMWWGGYHAIHTVSFHIASKNQIYSVCQKKVAP